MELEKRLIYELSECSMCALCRAECKSPTKLRHNMLSLCELLQYTMKVHDIKDPVLNRYDNLLRALDLVFVHSYSCLLTKLTLVCELIQTECLLETDDYLRFMLFKNTLLDKIKDVFLSLLAENT